MIEEFKKHVLECYPQEACGIVMEGEFFPKDNCHPEPVNNFMLSEADSFELATLNKPYSILHSHTMESFKDDPRTPSYEDMKGQAASNIPWGIAHCDGENVTDLLYFGKPSEAPLLGRSYISNVYDCFTIARDFYWNNYKVDLASHPRPADWQEWNPHYIENTYGSLGFEELGSGVPQQVGDILLFSIATPYINHIGIVVEEGFIHHLQNRKSCLDTQEKWHKQYRKTLRIS